MTTIQWFFFISGIAAWVGLVIFWVVIVWSMYLPGGWNDYDDHEN